ncbi:MAG: glycosyltransferase [Candidatus Brocadiia bacterium]|nr:MAG: glycosyltransferase [Candidatus Brocadiia bacterium]
MSNGHNISNEPLVTVMTATYNRPKYLAVAIRSVINQTYGNLEICVINDGGVDVSDIIKSFNDPRILFINRKEHRGLPQSYNEAIKLINGKYVCYLNDDDLFYPHHVSTLVDALENKTDCHAAYSDLYKTYCRVEPDGTRTVLSKVLDVSRDFDRFLMLHYNHVLHVSLMHRRDMFDLIGPYNEDLNILIDWDLTRRLAFFTDFYHIHEITGEYYTPVGESDRISYRGRKDPKQYLRNVLAIRTTRPPKPWPRIDDLSIIIATDHLDTQTGKTIADIWTNTFYPYQLYLPLPKDELAKLDADMPNLITIEVNSAFNDCDLVDAALACCQGEYVAIVPGQFPIKKMWLEEPLYALIDSNNGPEAIRIEGSTQNCTAIVIKKCYLQNARSMFTNMPLCQSLQSAGILIRDLRPEEIPFQFDSLLSEAKEAEKQGDFAMASEIFEHMTNNYQNDIWTKSLNANALFLNRKYNKAAQLVSEINRRRPTVDTLLLEARIHKAQQNFRLAAKLLNHAKNTLEGNKIIWT